MIPKKIWQTYECPYEELPYYAVNASRTWVDLNPDWEYNYVTGPERRQFVEENFDKEWLDIWDNKCPIKVMQADIWRVMVVYKYGGLYADLDTHCKIPIEEWPNEDVLSHRVFLNAEHSSHLLSATFLAEPGHPMFESILNSMLREFNTPDFEYTHFVHKLTGPGAFTKGVYDFIGITDEHFDWSGWDRDNPIDLVNQVDYFNEHPNIVESGIYLTNQYRLLHETAVHQLYGSQNWNDGKYIQWINEREKVSQEYAEKRRQKEQNSQ